MSFVPHVVFVVLPFSILAVWMPDARVDLMACFDHQVKPFLKMSIQRLNLLVNKKANHSE